MEIAGYSFEHICEIEPTRSPDGSVQIVMPQSRYKNATVAKLNRHGVGPFCKFTIPSRYRTSGVYILAVEDAVRYVGECSNLSSRFNAGYGNISPRNCFQGGQETNCRVNNLIFIAVEAGERVSLSFFATADYKAMESALRAALRLSWNRI